MQGYQMKTKTFNVAASPATCSAGEEEKHGQDLTRSRQRLHSVSSIEKKKSGRIHLKAFAARAPIFNKGELRGKEP